MASRNFVIVRGDDGDVRRDRPHVAHERLHGGGCRQARGIPRAGDVLGVITKEHVADSVAASIQIYPGER